MSKRLDLDIVLERINKKCKERNYEFLGFCNKDGNDCEYYGNTTLLKLHCNICGNNWNMIYKNFLYNQGCKICNYNKQLYSLDKAMKEINECCIERNIQFLGFCDKDGNDCKWQGTKTYLVLKCEICDYEWRSTSFRNFTHNKTRCPQCSKVRRITEEEAILKIKERCEEKDYNFLGFCDKDGNKVKFHGKETYLSLFCNKCQKEWHSAKYVKFVTLRHNCPYCNKMRKKTEDEALNDILNRAKEIDVTFLGFFNEDNTKSQWNDVKCKNIKLKCNKCGYEYFITYDCLINGKVKCKKCMYKALREKSLNEEKTIIEKIQKICKEKNYEFLGFCDKDKNECRYIGLRETYLKLHCNICGNNWETCTVSNFFKDRGCPKCRKWHLEEVIKKMLEINKYSFERNKKFDWLKNLEIDFYLNDYNIGIECQGLQHFKSISYWGGDEAFKIRFNNDMLKYRLCKENGVKLLYYSNLGIEYPYEVFEDKEKLLEEIKKNE